MATSGSTKVHDDIDVSAIPAEQALMFERYASAVDLIERVPFDVVASEGRAVDGFAEDVALDPSAFPRSIARSSLTAEALSDALADAGCLIVRGLLDTDVALGLNESIDRAFDSYDAWERSRGTAPGDEWFSPAMPRGGWVHVTRPWIRLGGGVLTADSPTVFARWTELVRESGLYDVIERHFAEPPVTSLDKGTLRRVRSGDGIEWHQDAAFLGLDSGAINVWQSLSDTSDAPALDLVARRFDRVVETGTRGAGYDWSVGDDLVRALARETPIVRPHFAPGDAMIFDGRLLHRTAAPPPALPGTRYAIETWFFRPSRFPSHQQVPLAFGA